MNISSLLQGWGVGVESGADLGGPCDWDPNDSNNNYGGVADVDPTFTYLRFGGGYQLSGDPEPSLVPTEVAASPTIPEANVVSIFSESYGTSILTNVDPFWNQSGQLMICMILQVMEATSSS